MPQGKDGQAQGSMISSMDECERPVRPGADDEHCRCRRAEPEERRSGGRAGRSCRSRCGRKPADAKLRVFLFQLLCVLGQWERALNQLKVASELDASALAMAQMYGEAVRCEAIRRDVFAGKKSPMVFGEPEQWLALLIESLLVGGRGDAAEPRSCGSAPSRRPTPSAGRDQRPAVRVDRRCRLAARPGARGGDQRPLLLGAVLASRRSHDRGARGSARHGLDAGAAAVRERRRDGRADSDALSRVGSDPTTA